VRVLPFLLVAAVVGPRIAEARPNADVVIVWAPGAKVAPVAAAARQAGAAMIDRSPPPRQRADTASILRRGIAAYDALRLADAMSAFDEARAAVDRTGAADVTQTELSDLFLYRGLVKLQQNDPTAAWDELIIAATVAPARVLDPARFPPRVATEIDRARTSLKDRPTSTLVVAAPTGCTVSIDGAELSAIPSASALPGAGVPRPQGSHWTSVNCVDRGPWGTRVELTSDVTLTPRNAPITPPSADDVLIQARTTGAQAFVVVEVAGNIGTARLVGVDGRERDRRTVTIPVSGDLAGLGSAVRGLLSPVPKGHWYQSRWAWAAGAAVLAAAIVVPITAIVAGNNAATTWTVGKPTGMITW
jgi:hypothetical protein